MCFIFFVYSNRNIINIFLIGILFKNLLFNGNFFYFYFYMYINQGMYIMIYMIFDVIVFFYVGVNRNRDVLMFLNY